MSSLPANSTLPISLLAACFNNTSATYKFYWLLSILDALESRIDNKTTAITKRELFARMITNAWYTVHYFHISFGKQDKLLEAVLEIRELLQIGVEQPQKEVLAAIMETDNPEVKKYLKQFDKYVPHHFLSPWFPGKDRKFVYENSQQTRFNIPYSLHQEFIDVDLLWASYFINNILMIRGFCYWNLVIFLQSRNPNVPDIPNKLIKPPSRNSLIKQREFWNIVIRESGYLRCIYTDDFLQKGNFAVEHFVPYNFVLHDLIWNLIPANIAFNSIKSDKLPRLGQYFDPFFELQFKGASVVCEKAPRNPFLEDYLIIFPDFKIDEKEVFKTKLWETISPLITIAANNGFEFLK